MSLVQINCEVEYPESDGRPMGETDRHRYWMRRIYDLFKYRYRGQQVYVGSDLLLYYEEDAPQQFVVPDDFVVLDVAGGERRIYKLWEEGKPPNVVLEVTSKSTRQEDTVLKFGKYAAMGVREYYLYDPTGEYLAPALQGFRLSDEAYVRIEPDDRNALACEELAVVFRLEAGRLVMNDRNTGALLLTEAESESQRAEAESQRAEAESQRADQERIARESAELRIQELEAELKRLRGD